MKALEKNSYSYLNVSKEFNKIILEQVQGYDGKKKEQLKSFLEDINRMGCVSGMISDFIYHADCKQFYIEHIDELEEIKEDLEENLGERIKNKHNLPHYTFICWLCFEEYCYSIYNEFFDN